MLAAVKSFGGLSSAERRYLREWQLPAVAIGVDAVEDLTLRPWPCPVSGSVFGVFTRGSRVACWLVVGEEGAWVIAYCVKGEVSRALNSLADALALIHFGEAAPNRLEAE